MNSELTNQSVIVVGGTSGMGLAIARLAKSRGASVTVASRSSDKVAAVATEMGAVGKPIDTSDEASVRDFFAAVGPVDHLIVTGSSVRTGTLKDAPLEDGEFYFPQQVFRAVSVRQIRSDESHWLDYTLLGHLVPPPWPKRCGARGR